MELWIRSQDRETMLCVHAVAIAKDKVNSILGCGIDRNMKLELGTYKTKERALDVLDEIEEVLEQPQKHIEGDYTYYMPNDGSSKVYEMPQE